MMFEDLGQRLWRRWTIILLVSCLASVFAAAWFAEQIVRQSGREELAKTVAVVGNQIAADLERAIGFGIPVAQLREVDSWFRNIVNGNAILESITLTDERGKLLASHHRQSGSERSPQSVSDDKSASRQMPMFIKRLKLADQKDVGVLRVVAAAPAVDFVGYALWVLAGLASAACAALGLRYLVCTRIAMPLSDLRKACEMLGRSTLMSPRARSTGQVVDRLSAVIAGRIDRVTERRRQALTRVAEVRAAHFAPGPLAEIDALQGRLLEWSELSAQPAPAAHLDPARTWTLPRQLRALVTAALLAFTGSGLLVAHSLGLVAEQELIRETARGLKYVWQADLGFQLPGLLRKMNMVRTQSGVEETLQRGDFERLPRLLQSAASDGELIAIFTERGSLIASNFDRRSNAGVREAETLKRLADNAIPGFWQGADLRFLTGIVDRMVSSQGARYLVVIAHAADQRLAPVQTKLGVRVALADLRGQSVGDDEAGLTQRWRSNERQPFGYREGNQSFLLNQIPLTDPFGREIGTLLARFDLEKSLGVHEWIEILCALALAGLGIALLFRWGVGAVDALETPVSRLQRLAKAGDGDKSSEPAPLSAQAVSSTVERIESIMSNFELMRRSRDRQGYRQSRFMRHQIKSLADRLAPDASKALLEDLARIESTTDGVAMAIPGRADARSVAASRSAQEDEIGVLAVGFQTLMARVGDQYEELNRLVDELREALRVKTQFVAIQRELEIASKMQLAILPRPFESVGGLRIEATMQAATDIGGDFYDFFKLDENRVALAIADVSGKGIPAALFMAVSRTLLRAVAQFSQTPGDCLVRLNNLLAEENERMMFVTLFYAVLDLNTGQLSFANAGHNPPLLLRANGEIEEIGRAGGTALAVMEGLPYANQSIQVNRGDRLFLYTDGVTEAFDPDRNMFGVERLYSLLEQLRTMPLQEVPAQVLAQVIAFERGGEQTDDITCLVASFDPPDSRES